jgi:hypothetical protein
LGELVEVAGRNFEFFVEAAIACPLAQRGRHYVLDDPVVEPVARQPNAPRRQRRRDDRTVAVPHPQNGEVARAAAEITDEDGCLALQPPHEEIGGC